MSPQQYWSPQREQGILLLAQRAPTSLSAHHLRGHVSFWMDRPHVGNRMADPLHSLIQRLRGAGDAEPLGDAELLGRFVRGRDPAAFEVLVWRHGPMVLGCARRSLGNDADAEDAFQATFLTLARKAGSIRRGGALAAWLHLVARRIAGRIRQQRRPLRSLDGRDIAAPGAAPPDELACVLDEEIAGLPERFRRAVVLCYLEGHSAEEAAELLGCPRGTVLSRL